VPQLDVPEPPPQRAPHDAGHHQPPRQVEEEQQISPRGQYRPRGRVLPLRRPPLTGTQSRHVIDDLRAGHPCRATMKGIELRVRRLQARCYAALQSRLPRAGGTGYQHPRGSVWQLVGPFAHPTAATLAASAACFVIRATDRCSVCRACVVGTDWAGDAGTEAWAQAEAAVVCSVRRRRPRWGS